MASGFQCDQCQMFHSYAYTSKEGVRPAGYPKEWYLLSGNPEDVFHLCSWKCVEGFAASMDRLDRREEALHEASR